MAFGFTTLTGTETAGWNSINALITSIDTQLDASNRLIFMSGTPSNGQSISWDASNARWSAALLTDTALANGAVTASKLASTLDLSSKTITLPATSVTAGMLAGTLDLTGKTVTVATATAGDNDTSVASTAFVTDAISTAVADVTAGTAYAVGGDLSGTTGDATIINGAVTNDKLAGSISNDKLLTIAPSKVTGTAVTQADSTTVTQTMLTAAVQAALNPVGTIQGFAGSTAPSGWLICDGSTIPNGLSTTVIQGNAIGTNFAPLYLIIGSSYGSTGKLPDLRGRIPMGQTTGTASAPALDSNISTRGLGTKYGAESLPAHTHVINNGGVDHYHGYDRPYYANEQSGSGATSYTVGASSQGFGGSKAVNTGGASAYMHAHTMDNGTNGQGGAANTASGTHGVVQPSQAINYIIKY